MKTLTELKLNDLLAPIMQCKTRYWIITIQNGNATIQDRKNGKYKTSFYTKSILNCTIKEWKKFILERMKNL